MKEFNNSHLNNVIRTQRKNNSLNWVTPLTEFWFKRIVKLLIELVVIVFIVYSLVFLLFQIIPGQPKAITDALSTNKDPSLIDSQVAALKHKFHLDGNLMHKYIWSWRTLFDGTMGISWTTNAPISMTFWSRLGTSVTIGFISILMSLFIGIPTGIYLARRDNRFSDALSTLFSIIAFSIPSFVFALLSVAINAALGLPIVFDFGNIFMFLLPALMIAIPTGLGYTRYLRSSIREEYKEQYVSLARIKGVKERKILTSHILKPALFPIINYFPFLVVAAFFGSITIESVFAIPGTGNMLISAALEHDQPALLSITLFYTVFMVLSFFIRDILVTFVDPRIKGE